MVKLVNILETCWVSLLQFVVMFHLSEVPKAGVYAAHFTVPSNQHTNAVKVSRINRNEA